VPKIKLEGMDELEEGLSQGMTMSHQEILQRFKKLFGREMTSLERKAFFLPQDNPEEKTS
jgi:hypothetical protein